MRALCAWAVAVVAAATAWIGGAAVTETQGPRTVLVIHGGAGTLPRARMTPGLRQQYEDDLRASLRAGHAVLNRGGTSLDAVEAAIKVLEDSPRFNAGKGAVFTRDRRHELDASIMDGATRKAGAVAAVTVVKNPIAAARAVMDRSPHVFLAGPGADQFARDRGLEIVDPSYFHTPERLRELERFLEENKRSEQSRNDEPPGNVEHLGTVGAVALDRRGNLAAGNSTGGLTGKHFGRIGDTPIIGAGTFADNASCAVACTGHGEFFIRYVVAHEIAARVQYRKLSVEQAADSVINATLKQAGGEGGAIALDARGNFAMPFNSEGMYRGYITEDGVPHVLIYRDDR